MQARMESVACSSYHMIAHTRVRLMGSAAGLECESPSSIRTESTDFSEDLRSLCNHGKLQEALQLLQLNHHDSTSSSDYVCLVQACVRLRALAEAKEVHAHIVNTGFKPTIFLWTAVMNMYVQCKSLTDARQVFDIMPERDLFTWNTMIAAYAKQGQPRLAFQLFCSLESDGLRPEATTLVSILKACATFSLLELGKYIHGHIVKFGVEVSLFTSNTLINMYAKCCSIDDARNVFDKMEEGNVVTWTAMIAGYTKQNCYDQALKLYDTMKQNSVSPNEVTFVCALNACAGLRGVEQGKSICTDIQESGIQPNLLMQNACIDMYVKCGCVGDAWQVFVKMNRRDVVTWTTMIAGCAQQGYSDKAFSLFKEMEQEGHEPGDISLVSNFNAFASLGNLEQAKAVHAFLMKFLTKPNDFVGSALVDMYVKCKSIDDAREAFCLMPKKDVIMWNAMLTGYCSQGNIEESMEFLHQMDIAEVKPNETTFTIILNACSNIAALRHGKYIHSRVVKTGICTDTFVGSALVNMYTKCGFIEEAEQVFYYIVKQDVVLYTSMIAAYAQHNQSYRALHLAHCMDKEGIKPNHVTFVGVLTACSHAGLMDEGFFHFTLFNQAYGINPMTEHYVCMVDLLGRAGRLEEAEFYVKELISKPNAMAWRVLLSACRNLGDVEKAECVADCIVELLPEDEGAFVLLSNVYGASGMDDD
ncbi:hypothetical protein L7F22_038431 [Adiantum nelumboides]|nr:hypothetical protein [Adiantum nelumboides]